MSQNQLPTHMLQKMIIGKRLSQKNLTQLFKHDHWCLVPYCDDMNLLSFKWVYHIGYNSDGSVNPCKAHFVIRGLGQLAGLEQGLSPIVKPTTICIIFFLLLSYMVRSWDSLMLKIFFYMATFMKRWTWPSHKVFFILITLTMCASWIGLYIAWNRLIESGFTSSTIISFLWTSLVVILILPWLYFLSVMIYSFCFFMWMILFFHVQLLFFVTPHHAPSIHLIPMKDLGHLDYFMGV